MKGIFDTSPYLLSCDWGTTSFRLSLVDRTEGQVISKLATQVGIKNMFTRWKQAGGDGGRIHFYLGYLQEQIEQLETQTDRSIDGIPITVSGMASSSIGMAELPYASVPFSLDEPNVPSQFFPESERFSHDLLLLSGLRTANDVMRGEEMQLLGLATDHELTDCVCIMPGTHSKHVFVEEQQITQFKTYMSGEVFALLSSQSILADSVQFTDEPLKSEAFREGIDRALDNDFLHSIFGIRTNDLLLRLDKTINADLLSGLIIGTELSKLADTSPAQIFLLGNDALVERYTVALHYLDLDATTIPDIDKLTIQGHLTILNHKI